MSANVDGELLNDWRDEIAAEAEGLRAELVEKIAGSGRGDRSRPKGAAARLACTRQYGT
jgi:hypothetical protein